MVSIVRRKEDVGVVQHFLLLEDVVDILYHVIHRQQGAPPGGEGELSHHTKVEESKVIT